MKRPTPTEAEKKRLRKWLRLGIERDTICPFLGWEFHCTRCQAFFPEMKDTPDCPAMTHPCRELGTEVVAKIVQEELLNGTTDTD